jgi:lysophospholipase
LGALAAQLQIPLRVVMGVRVNTFLISILLLQGLLASGVSASGYPCGYQRLGFLARLFGSTPKVDLTVTQPMGHDEPRPISTSEATLERDYKTRILPFFESGKVGEFKGQGDVPIHYRTWDVPNAKGTVVLVHGASESMSVYMEMVYNLAEKGYNVYMMDQRGHGHSGRMTKDPGMLHVDKFTDYVDDLETFVDKVVKPNGHAKYNVMGSSMGGQVAVQFALRRPAEVERLVLSTPMLAIKFPMDLPTRAAQTMAMVMKWAGLGKEYAPSEHAPPDEGWETRPDGRQKVAWQMRLQQQSVDKLVDGASNTWVEQSANATYRSWPHLQKLKMPVLILKAGKDTRIQNGALDQAAQRIPNAKLITYPDAQHGIVRGDDAVRDPYLRDIFEFLGSPP